MGLISKLVVLASLLYSNSFSSLYAQNVLFIPFGQSEKEVRAFVDENVILSELAIDQKEKRIKITDSLRNMSYDFHEKGLYKITDTRTYNSQEQARSVVKACLDYLKLFDQDIAKPKKSENIEHYLIMGENKIIEVRATGFSKNKHSTDPVTVQLISTAMDLAPREEVGMLTALFSH